MHIAHKAIQITQAESAVTPAPVLPPLGYSLLLYSLCLLPLGCVLIAITFTLGTGSEVVEYYTDLRLRSPLLTACMQGVSTGGAFVFYAIYSSLFLRGIQNYDSKKILFVVAFILAQILVALMLTRIVKIAVGRPRPTNDAAWMPFSISGGHQSFPSGHTTEVIGQILPLGIFWKQCVPALLMGCFAALVGFSRIYLGMHHSSDIFGGMLFGLGSSLITLYLWSRLQS